jgi:Golgi nucleoside diphosphatase
MYFSTDALYNSYDTSEIIDNMKKQKFISNKEVLYQNKDLRKVYSDYNFDSFIDRCREMLGDIWDDTTNIEIPF